MKNDIWNIPNLLSLSRLPLAVVLFYCIGYEHWTASFLLFVVASATDWADGFWARRFGPMTPVGRSLDPLTDKVLVGGSFIYLLSVPGAALLTWMVALVIGRELWVTGVRGFVETQGKKFGADILGKLKMFLQSVWIGAVLLIQSLHSNSIVSPWVDALLIVQLMLLIAMLIATAVSGFQYTVKAYFLLTERTPPLLSRRDRQVLAGIVLVGVFLTAMLAYTKTGNDSDVIYPSVDESPYRLPYPADVSHLCVQGNSGFISHFERERFAYDFAMPVGSPVCAARSGIVSQIEMNYEGYGINRPGNQISIVHGDGTTATYLHLKRSSSKVYLGQFVPRGKMIAESGNVGNSLIPHLHFHVTDDSGITVPVVFPDAERTHGTPLFLSWYVSLNRD